MGGAGASAAGVDLSVVQQLLGQQKAIGRAHYYRVGVEHLRGAILDAHPHGRIAESEAFEEHAVV